jgi:hypothetical protein
MPQPQSYKNHGRVFPLFHYFVLPILTIGFLNAIRHVVHRPARETVWEVVYTLGLLILALTARAMALSVQDRVIRLEMQLRLRSLLTGELQTRVSQLTPKQLVALRFASDEELPSLVSEVLAGKLPTSRAIKQRIQNWQADHLRA